LLLFGLAAESTAAPPKQHARLHTVVVKRPHIVVRGAYLGKVEIWTVPTGTEITEDAYVWSAAPSGTIPPVLARYGCFGYPALRP
jgi:hypothetical protein